MFEDAFKGNLWAGGRVPNVMAELQRAILDGVLDLRSIEAHRLVCLSHNLHVKDLRQTRYTKSFVEFLKYLSCLPSAAATHRARRGRVPHQPGELTDPGRPRFNELLPRQDYIAREVRTSISAANDAGGALLGNVGCGQKVQRLEAFLSGLLRATEGGSTTDKLERVLKGIRLRAGTDGTHTKEKLSMTISKKTGLVLEGDACHPSVDEKLAALRRTMSDILMPMRQSVTAGQIITAEGETIVVQCLTKAGAFVEGGLAMAREKVHDLSTRLETLSKMRQTARQTQSADDVEDGDESGDEEDITHGAGLVSQQERQADNDEADELEETAERYLTGSDATAGPKRSRQDTPGALRKALEHLLEAKGMCYAMSSFVESLKTVDVRRSLVMVWSAMDAAGRAQRSAANQVLEYRLRDLCTDTGVVIARYLVRNPTESLLNDLLGQTQVLLLRTIAVLGGCQVAVPRCLFIATSSDGEGSGVLWGSAEHQRPQTTSEVRKRAQEFTQGVAAEAAKAVDDQKKIVAPNVLKGVRKIEKEIVMVHVVQEIERAQWIRLRKELELLDPSQSAPLISEAPPVITALMLSDLCARVDAEAARNAELQDSFMLLQSQSRLERIKTNAERAGLPASQWEEYVDQLFERQRRAVEQDVVTDAVVVEHPQEGSLSATLRARLAAISQHAVTQTTAGGDVAGDTQLHMTAFDETMGEKGDTAFRKAVEEAVLDTLRMPLPHSAINRSSNVAHLEAWMSLQPPHPPRNFSFSVQPIPAYMRLSDSLLVVYF